MLITDHNFAVRGYRSSVASPCNAWMDSKRLNLCAGILPLHSHARCHLTYVIGTLVLALRMAAFSLLFLKGNSGCASNFIAACAC